MASKYNRSVNIFKLLSVHNIIYFNVLINLTDGTWSGNWSWNQTGGGWCWNSVTPHVSKPAAVPSTFTPNYPALSDVSAPIIPQPAAFPYTPPQAPSSNDNFPSSHVSFFLNSLISMIQI